MPYPNEHAARLNEPGKYKSFARQNDKGGAGVDFIFGVLPNGKSEIQAVRFDKEKFTADEARKWIKDHDMKTIEFEEAIQKSQEREDLTTELIVKGVTESNGRFFYELAYMLDGTKGGDPRNLMTIDSPVDSDVSFQKGAVLQIACSGVEPIAFPAQGKYGVSILNPQVIGISQERKLPETAKAILRKAEYLGGLLASEYLKSMLAEVGILKQSSGRKLSYETIGEDSIVKYEFPFYKDATKQIVYGVVYEPFDGTNQDVHGDYASAEEIEKAAHSFMDIIRGGSGGSNLMHIKDLPEGKAKVCESYIAPADFYVNGQLIRKGSWVLGTHIVDSDLWKLIQDGTLNAYSMEGTGKTADFFKHADSTISKRCLFDMIIKAVALVDKGANRKKFFLMKRDDTMKKEEIIALVKSVKMTPEQAEALAVKFGFKDADLVDIKKEGTTPTAPPSNEELINKAVNTALTTLTAAIEKAIGQAAGAPGGAGDTGAGGGQDTAAKCPEGLTPEQKVQWYLEHPDADIPDDMMDAVATALADRKQKELAQSMQ
jgi:hypothetical protein